MQKIPTSRWITKIILLQISLLLIYFGFSKMTGQVLPIRQPAPEANFLTSLTHTLVFQGLFPWSIIALFALSFSLIAYTRNQDSYFHSIITAPFKKLAPGIYIILDNLARNLVYLSLGLTAVLATLCLATLIAGVPAMQRVTGLTPGAIGAIILMCVLTFRRSTNPTFTLIQTQRPSFGFLLNMLLWGVLLAAAAFAFYYFTTDNNTTLPAGLITPILNTGYTLHWNIFITSLLFCFAPLLSLYIARFSYGYSIRALIGGTLILPLLLAIILGLNAHFHWVIQLNVDTHLAQSMPLIGVILLVYLVLQKETVAMTNLVFVAKPGPIKPRNIANFIGRWKKLTGVLFYLFLPAGIYVISLFLAFGIVTGVLATLFACTSVIYLLRNLSAH